VSITISQREKIFSVNLRPVDDLGRMLLQRIRELLAARADINRNDFARRIGRPTPSWISEFFAGKRTTNDLRLVVKMAKVFSVPVGYLLNETGPEMDATTLSLFGVWRDLHDPHDREAVLQLALTLKAREEQAADRSGGTGGGSVRRR
jgi:transcriptional regulator with XRE-family HTH domain